MIAPSSLRRRLLLLMLVPAGSLALLLGIGGALLIHQVVEVTHDRLLDGSVMAIADRISVDDGDEVEVDLPRVALAMLESRSQDSVFYSVSDGNEVVTGYRDLPPPNKGIGRAGEIVHFSAAFRDSQVRIAATTRLVYGHARPITIQVAETRRERLEMESRMLVGLALLEIILLATVALLADLGIKRGLIPLTDLREELLRRTVPGAVMLHKLGLAGVPVEVVELVEALNTLLERLEQTIATVRNFTADASHQMRTPLAVLRLHLRLAGKQTVDEAQSAALADAKTATIRLEKMVNQLIVLARLDEADETAGRIELVELGAIVASVLAERVPHALQREIELALERPETEVPVLGNEVMIGEIVGNLLDNAINHNAPGGSVIVRIGEDRLTARIEIEDDGPGIPDEERGKVFERFYRVNRRDAPTGSGLGLAIVRALADRLGASITLRAPQSGRGLLATVRLRRAISK